MRKFKTFVAVHNAIVWVLFALGIVPLQWFAIAAILAAVRLGQMSARWFDSRPAIG